MKITSIRDPLDGEQLVAIDPPPARRADAGWRRRLHLFTGRSLSHDALDLEQRHRAGHLAVLGQTLSPGVVQGLEADLEEVSETPVGGEVPEDPGPEGGAERRVLRVAPGYGLTVQGEDVIVPRVLRSPLGRLRVQVPDPSRGRLVPRSLGPTLDEVLALGLPVPRAAFLVLQPITGERLGVFDDTDPCERDPANEAFEDQQRIDGVRLVLDLWPTEWLPLPPPGPRFRNRAAYAIFERERELGAAMPWHRSGLPIALLFRNAPDAPFRIDRHAVVRAGGRPRARQSLVAGSGDRFLRRARVEQLAEHLADLAEATGQVRAVEHFRFLPPAGILPRAAVDFDWDGGFQTAFFPPTYDLVASPLSLTEVDSALEQSAALPPLPVRPAERPQVEILVPVPESLFDPRLLVRDEIDPEFGETTARFLERRAELRQRRDDVRGKLTLLSRNVDGEAPAFPPDPADEQPATGVLDPAEEDYGTEVVDGIFQVGVVDELTDFFSSDPVLSEPLELIDSDGLEAFIDQLEDKVKRADGKIDLGFARSQTDIYRFRHLVLGATAATRLTTSPALASIAQGTSAVATKRDLTDFLQGLEAAAAGGSAAPRSGDDGGAKSGGSSGAAGAGTKSSSLFGGSFALADGFALAGDLTADIAGPAGAVSQPFFGGAFADIATSVFDPSSITVTDVVEQAPIVGQPLRTTTVGERLREPPSAEARNFAVANRFEVFRGIEELSGLGLFVDDLPVPGVAFDDAGDVLDLNAQTGLPTRNTLTFSQVVPHRNLLPSDPEPSRTDESSYFNIAVEIVDHTVVLLRNLERRVHTYKRALERARRALATVKALRSKAGARLNAIDKELAEARHDVEVARSLADEEQSRIDAVNARRQRIVRDEVHFLAFRRVRTVDLLSEVPVRRLEPALAEDAAVACLSRPVEVPAELRAMVELFREAPIQWFRRLPGLLDQLDRPDVLHRVLASSRDRAARLTLAPAAVAAAADTGAVAAPAGGTLAASASFTSVSFAASSISSGGTAVASTLQTTLASTLSANRQLVAENRTAVASLDLSGLQRLSWLDARREAEKHVALGDLLDAGHGRPAVVQQAARELDEIARLGACLYAGFGEVPASIRLDWAERLSQFDRPVDLADLSRLPRWQEIDFTERRELQGLVDGIYQRLDRRRQGILALAHDLVRVCILLASHAPVSRLIAGQVEEPTTVKKGGQVKVRVEALQPVHIGMPVMFFSASQTAARGVVENLAGNVATARVVEAFQENVQLTVGARVELAETRAFERKGLGAGGGRADRRRRFREVL